MKKLGYKCWSKNKAKTDFEKDFFKSMDNAVFRKTIENVREGRRNNLVSEPKYHITNFFFSEKLLAIKMREKLRYLWINLSIWDFKY